MEYFASDPRVVSTFARHFQTLEQIPITLLNKLYASKNIFCASELQNQIYYSMLDQVYHSAQLEKPSTEILKEIQGKYYELPYVENTAWQLRFSHLVGYGAKYYSYLVSRAICFLDMANILSSRSLQSNGRRSISKGMFSTWRWKTAF